MMDETEPGTMTIDKTTSVNIGILATLITSAVGGAVYLTTLNGNVAALTREARDLRAAVEANTQQSALDGRLLAVQQAMIAALEKRVESMERAIERQADK